jgi:beta-glucanase (GH16 family)
MNSTRVFYFTALLLISFSAHSAAQPQLTKSAGTKILLNMRNGAEKHLTPSSDHVTFSLSKVPASTGVDVNIQPGKDEYPGVNIKPDAAAWNLLGFGHVAARVANTGAQSITLSLRVDNAGNWQDNPWNTESITLMPGASGVVTVIFGRSYGYKSGYALNPAAVVNMVIFASKSNALQSFRIESIMAGGHAGEKPPVAPDDIRVDPPGGILLGTGVSNDGGAQVTTSNARASLTKINDKSSMSIVFPAGLNDQTVSLKPSVGRWDLRKYQEVQVKLRSTGKIPITPLVRLDSNGGSTEWISSSAPLKPDAEAVITIPFAGLEPVDLNKKGSGSQITSDAISAVTFSVKNATEESRILVESINAVLPQAPKTPEWLGKRPPVDGDWVKTLDDEFNGSKLDMSIWSIYGANYWDKESHWSKDDVIVGGGVVRLRYEKKTGFNNDDPKQKKTDYAAGYLHTFEKWRQRYGYFEARMKLPTAPGLWPAFWMMPDRGAETKTQGDRQDTGNGGMEFDVMEHLDRWGLYRYNIAMHYDGYGKDHKSVGSEKIYIQPDKEGYITCGLLWTPGSARYYCNGREVLRWDNPRISHVPSDLMFTIPQGGWDNDPIDNTRLPDDFIIDYVRVWQRKDLASDMDGKEPALQAKP